MTATVLRAHAADLPLEDGSVDLIVTSPPYFGLRSYTDGGEHYAGQIGSEGTPGEWLDALWACTREWVRVLKPEGSLFVNLGDKYVADNRGSGFDVKRGPAKHAPAGPLGYLGRDMARHKSLLGLPWRYAIGCTDRLGLILRAEIVWAKPNGLPESVQDRVRRSHEQVFHFTRLPRYYAAVDEIRESAGRVPRPSELLSASGSGQQPNHTPGRWQGTNGASTGPNPLGKLPGSVWDIPSQPLQVPAQLGVDHFAAFPMELPRRCIMGWSPPGVCTACGQGRRPVVLREVPTNGHRYLIHDHGSSQSPRRFFNTSQDTQRVIVDYVCPCLTPSRALPPARPAVVLDPFGGTGTTALVASVLGRHGITADLSADYCRLAAWRTSDPGERARAMQVPKPPPVSDGQEALFSL